MNRAWTKDWRGPRWRCTGCALALGLAVAGPARAQGLPAPIPSPPPVALFRLPFEVAQDALFADAAKDVRYSFAVSALPGIGYGILDVNALISGIYRNPAPDCFFCTFDVGTGLRSSLAFLSTLEGALDFRIAAEAEYLWRAQNARAAGGFLLDLSSLLRLGIWGGRDWAADAYYFSFTLAIDVMTLHDPVGALLQPGPMQDFGDAK